jgi:hypothetical protein
VDGVDGVSIVWLGAQAAAPATPNLNEAYYNTTSGQSFIWDGSAWNIIAQDGVINVSGSAIGDILVWNGSNWVAGTDGDNNSTNEIQNISISGNQINISSGGTGFDLSPNAPIDGNVLTWNGILGQWEAQPSGSSNVWELTGNSGTSATDFIGTTDAQDLRFRTNNIERMVVSQNGLIGVGISSPAVKLHVYDGFVGSQKDGLGWVGMSGAWGDPVISWNNTGYLRFGTTTVFDDIATGWSQKMIISPSGDVGIGISNPQVKLHIGKDTNSVIFNQVASNNANIQSGIIIGRSRGSISTPLGLQNGDSFGEFGFIGHDGTSFDEPSAGIRAEATENFTSTNHGAKLLFSTTSNGTSSGAERMVIDHNGNVGIGTITPNNTLHVNGTFQLQNASAAVGYVLTSTDALGNATWQPSPGNSAWNLIGNSGTGATDFIGTTDAQDLRFRTNNTEKMVITSSGNVGIGTNSPTYKLETIGDIKANAYYFPEYTLDRSPVITARPVPVGQRDDAGVESSELILFHSNDFAGGGCCDDDYITLRSPAIRFQTYAVASVEDISNNLGSNTRMIIKNDGKVGIGIINPTQKFQVGDGNILISNTTNTAGEMRFAEPSTSGTNYTAFRAQAQAADITYNLPSSNGGAGTVLTNNGSGTLSWQTPSSTPSWNLTGNSGTTPATDFIGTTDNVPLNFKVNNQVGGTISQNGPTFFGYRAGNGNTGATSTSFGYQALESNTTGTFNTAIGYNSGRLMVSSFRMTAIGYNALTNNTASDNTAVGANTLTGNTSAQNNTAVGSNALSTVTTGGNNTAIGFNAMANGTGSQSTAVGSGALINSNGLNNNAFGLSSMGSNTSGTSNVAFGNSSLGTNTTGNDNTAIGTQSLFNNNGFRNVALGYDAGNINTTGNNNIFIGYNANSSVGNLTNATAIGYNATVSQNNSMVFGDGTINVGIGTSSPSQRLHVNGNITSNNYLYNTSQSREKRVAPMSLVHHYQNNNVFIQGNSTSANDLKVSNTLAAPEYLYYTFDLPQGAVITGIHVNVFENDAGTIEAELFRQSPGNVNQSIGITNQSVNLVTNQWLSQTTLSNNTVDNTSFAYSLKITLGSGLTSFASIRGVRLTYTVSQTD